MNKNTTIKMAVYLSAFFLFNNAFANTEVEILRKNAEKNIQSCEQSYRNTEALKSRLTQMKKPSIFASKFLKEAYANRDLYIKVFNSRFEQFTTFTNDKVKIRTGTEYSKLQEEIAAYTSNCARFAAGLVGFVDWATTGKAAEGYARVYQNFVDEVKNGS